MQADVDAKQEITVVVVADSVVRHVSGLSFYYYYVAEMTVAVAAVVAAVVDSAATTLVYGLSSYYSAVVEMDFAKITYCRTKGRSDSSDAP